MEGAAGVRRPTTTAAAGRATPAAPARSSRTAAVGEGAVQGQLPLVQAVQVPQPAAHRLRWCGWKGGRKKEQGGTRVESSRAAASAGQGLQEQCWQRCLTSFLTPGRLMFRPWAMLNGWMGPLSLAGVRVRSAGAGWWEWMSLRQRRRGSVSWMLQRARAQQPSIPTHPQRPAREAPPSPAAACAAPRRAGAAAAAAPTAAAEAAAGAAAALKRGRLGASNCCPPLYTPVVQGEEKRRVGGGMRDGAASARARTAGGKLRQAGALCRASAPLSSPPHAVAQSSRHPTCASGSL